MWDSINVFFSIIGSIASVVGIPLAIYLYLKSKEAKFDKLKKDITKILSYQIGEERLLTTFEIKTVISSKLRENRIKTDSISVSEIIEDLVAETISSPLISKERKAHILENLKKLYFKGELFDKLDSIPSSRELNWQTLQPRFKEMIEAQVEFRKKSEDIQRSTDKFRQQQSTVYAVVVVLLTSLTLIIAFAGKDKFNEWNAKLDAPLKENEYIITLAVSAIVSIVAIFTTILLKKSFPKKEVQKKE